MPGSFAIHGEWDKAGLSKYLRFLDDHQARALAKAIDKALTKAVRPLPAKIKGEERSIGIHNRSGRLLRSIRARKSRLRAGEVAARTVGPTDRKAHLLIQGHEIVTPGGHDVGRQSRAFPFVEPVITREAPGIQAQLGDVWASGIRPL